MNTLDFVNKIEEYNKMFPDRIPTEPLSSLYTMEELVKIIDRCLREGKDVFELEYITYEEEAEY